MSVVVGYALSGTRESFMRLYERKILAVVAL